MRRLRSHIWIVFIFGLISLGQAYPYSMAWALSQKVECGCNRSGRACIHGCKLKNKPALDHSHASHAKHSQHHAHSAKINLDDQDCAWVSPNCSPQKYREILSFQSEPCLLPIFHYVNTPMVLNQETPFKISFSEWFWSQDPPPPKGLT